MTEPVFITGIGTDTLPIALKFELPLNKIPEDARRIVRDKAMKLELLTNATVVDDAIRFVASHATPMDSDMAAVDEEY